ncbi:MAG TPA: DUF3352 domain-containing protein [Solirubrobacterales bacterium]|nr:DUF3352 domain-containing protein [Solirubrobacterales bacterium]
MLKTRFLPTVLVIFLFAFVAGCGDGDDSLGSGLAGLAPPKAVVFVEGKLRPEGALRSNLDSVTRQIAGVDSLGDFVVSELEGSAEDEGESFDFEQDVEPWLGDSGAVAFQRLEDRELSEPIILIQSTDTAATQRLIDRVGDSSENEVAIVDDALVIAEDKRTLDAITAASEGESLANEKLFEETFSLASEGSFADAYVDVGGLLRQGEVDVDEQLEKGLEEAGVELDGAAALISLTPGANQVEIDIRSDFSETEAQAGSAPELLGSLPGRSFAALAFSGFGEQLQRAIDELDREGISESVPPGQLKSSLEEVGIDLDAIAGSIRDAGIFAVGETKPGLGGALVLTTAGSQATDAISSLGLLLRGADVSGVTALGGGLEGFSVREPEELGPKPLVVATRGDRIAIGYGLPATRVALASGEGSALSDNPAYDDAVASLGGTPVIGFADGPASLRLADALIPASDADFEQAKRFLGSIRFLALGSGLENDPATLKLIAGLKE